MGERLVEQIFVALDEQTVTVAGTTAAQKILPKLADSLREVLRQRDELAAEVEGMLDAHPLAEGAGPQPGSCSKSATAPLSSCPGTLPPTPGWPR